MKKLLDLQIPTLLITNIKEKLEKDKLIKVNPFIRMLQKKNKVEGVKVSAFHPKVFIFRYTDYLEVIIGSGNLSKLDWKT